MSLDPARITEKLNLIPETGMRFFLEKPILDSVLKGREGWERLPQETHVDIWKRKIGPRNFANIQKTGTLIECIQDAYRIREKEGASLSFEDKARITHSSLFGCQWNRQVITDEHNFDEARPGSNTFDPNLRLFGKIQNSLWRYQYAQDWNVTALAFNSIPNFKVPGFDVTIDWATAHNEKGYCAYNQNLFLDGPLAYLIHLKGKHVLTVSFAVLKGKDEKETPTICGPTDARIGITQIQLVNKTGNRFLYKFDRKKEIIKAFQKAFPAFSIWMVTGESMAKYLKDQIDKSMDEIQERKKGCDKKSSPKYVKEIAQAYDNICEKTRIFEPETKPRIISFYGSNNKKKIFRAGIHSFRMVRKRPGKRIQKTA